MSMDAARYRCYTCCNIARVRHRGEGRYVTDAHQTAAQRVTFLQKFPLWRALSDDALQAVAAAVSPESHATDAIVIRQGEPGDHLQIIISGQVEVRVHYEGSNVLTAVAVLGEGDCVGDMALLSGDPASADVVAMTDLSVWKLSRAQFNDLVSTHPGILTEFVKLVSRRLAATSATAAAALVKEQEFTRFLHEESAERYSGFVGNHKAIKSLSGKTEQLAVTIQPVLVCGERGTGKESVARRMHFHGLRRSGPMLSTDCRLITATEWGDKLLGPHTHAKGDAVCYAELVRGGTILLKNIEALPIAVQERLARFIQRSTSLGPDSDAVRVIATSRHSLETLEGSGRFSDALADAFAPNVIALPPLRERKRDIPDLARHFVEKHARRHDRHVTSLDDSAVTALVRHNYLIANIEELEEAIERAVMLTDDDTVAVEHIFLGQPATGRALVMNLLSLHAPSLRFALPRLRVLVSSFVALVFAGIAFLCFAPLFGWDGTLATTLVWSVWWPALALSFVFVGRAWCGVCPMGSAGALTQRLVGLRRRVPAWVKKYDAYLLMVGLFLIPWSEEVAVMRHSAVATGILLSTILGCAVLSGLVFKRRTWCRHLCPLGSIAGQCSISGIVELRPTPDVCAAKCKDHRCFTGNEDGEGCPLFNHVMFVEANRHCSLCMNCVRLCSNQSPQLNMRIPGRELRSGWPIEPKTGSLLIFCIGLVGGLAFLYYCERAPATMVGRLFVSYPVPFKTGALLASTLLPLLYARLAALLARSEEARSLYWRRIGAWFPLLAAAFICYEVAFIPGADGLQVALGYHAQALDWDGSLRVVTLLRGACAAAALAVSLSILVKISAGEHGTGAARRLKAVVPTFAAMLAYAALVLSAL
jgi:transcriptional regulator with AAA-type ATPase domain